jgi:hypothetical protein
VRRRGGRADDHSRLHRPGQLEPARERVGRERRDVERRTPSRIRTMAWSARSSSGAGSVRRMIGAADIIYH